MNTNKRPFAATMQLGLVILMIAGIVMIGQQFNKAVYQLGLIALVASTLVQIAFGNIPSAFAFRRSMKLFWPFMGIILIVFVVSFLATPLLYALGR
ncbi:MAG: hypothetical protein KatS3mg053_2136 [Candidatus Roseilinea sp.]|nr:MAG: hypothetical protein KatS3mg053_2136 [Candidatus Roseilinea sp.]